MVLLSKPRVKRILSSRHCKRRAGRFTRCQGQRARLDGFTRPHTSLHLSEQSGESSGPLKGMGAGSARSLRQVMTCKNASAGTRRAVKTAEPTTETEEYLRVFYCFKAPLQICLLVKRFMTMTANSVSALLACAPLLACTQETW